MNSKLKALSLALVAALALTAVMASAASAQFTYGFEHTIISGWQKAGTDDAFSAGEGFGGIICENTAFSGTAVNKAENTQVMTPTYSNCKDSFGRTIDVDSSGFTFTLTSGRGLEEGKGYLHISGALSLTVTSGGSVICTMSIKPQTNYPPAVIYQNLLGGIEIIFGVSDLDNTTSGGWFNCGVSNGEHFFGSYKGHAILTGINTSGAGSWTLID